MKGKPARGRKRRVFLLDDHPVMRAGIRVLIEQNHDLTVCGEAASANVALDQAQRLVPDLFVADLSLKSGTSGLELIKSLKTVLPDMPVLVVSVHDERYYAERALRAGALGYVMKLEPAERLIQAVRTVLNGEVFVGSAVKNRIVSRVVSSRPLGASFPVDTLSDREMEVFRLLGDGLSTRQIAKELHLSVKTIDSYREHLKSKLKLPDSRALVQHAIQWRRSVSPL